MLHRFAPLALLLAAGCSQTYSYEVAVANATGKPLSAGLTYPGSDLRDWATPEEIAINMPEATRLRWNWLIGSDQGMIRKQQGPYESAILRIYHGDRTISSLLTMSKGDPDRLDLYVEPGKTVFVITNQNGRLVAQRLPWTKQFDPRNLPTTQPKQSK